MIKYVALTFMAMFVILATILVIDKLISSGEYCIIMILFWGILFIEDRIEK